jgi:hypothetical protein
LRWLLRSRRVSTLWLDASVVCGISLMTLKDER